MTPLDLAMIAAIALVGAYPLLGYVAKLPKLAIGRPSPALESTKAEWRQEWVKTLITLQTELEEMGESNQADLCRQLVWEILGGDPDEVTA